MNSSEDHIKRLERDIQFLRKGIKEKNTIISSLIPLKMLESKCCKANCSQNFSNTSSCLQEQGKESTNSGNASAKNVKEVEKTKPLDNIKTTSFRRSTKQGNGNSNIRDKFEKWRAIRACMGDMLVWVAWVECLRGWRASVGGMSGVLAWVAC